MGSQVFAGLLLRKSVKNEEGIGIQSIVTVRS